MKLSDIKSFVNSLGAWQSKDCYETKAVRLKQSVIVYNDCPWLEKDRCTDPVTIDIGSNGMGKIVSIDCELGADLCSPYVRKFYEKCLKENAFDMYVVDREEA
nr:MAG TPA: hypothetical protein [Caudoviricetes sp.]